jgi:hypothetical protein
VIEKQRNSKEGCKVEVEGMSVKRRVSLHIDFVFVSLVTTPSPNTQDFFIYKIK